MKTARFSELVKAAGPPEVYTLWSDPKKDRAFQSALKSHRVLSVHQEPGANKADYGTIGYEADQQAELLIFPKSLKPFTARKIIGLKYDLLKQPPEESRPKPTPARAKPTRSKKPKPAPKAKEVKPAKKNASPPPAPTPATDAPPEPLDRETLLKASAPP